MFLKETFFSFSLLSLSLVLIEINLNLTNFARVVIGIVSPWSIRVFTCSHISPYKGFGLAWAPFPLPPFNWLAISFALKQMDKNRILNLFKLSLVKLTVSKRNPLKCPLSCYIYQVYIIDIEKKTDEKEMKIEFKFSTSISSLSWSTTVNNLRNPVLMVSPNKLTIGVSQ